eukprot:7126599-Alexandrium_andersonii.AAC.1
MLLRLGCPECRQPIVDQYVLTYMRNHPAELRWTRAEAQAQPHARGARWIGEGRVMASRRFWLPSFDAVAPAAPVPLQGAHAAPGPLQGAPAAPVPLFEGEIALWSELDTRDGALGAPEH